MYCYNGAQWYEQFSHVGRLYDWALILIGLALFSKRLCVFGLRGGLYILKKILLRPISFSLPFSELSLMGLALDVVD